jgi:hypothetical protein
LKSMVTSWSVAVVLSFGCFSASVDKEVLQNIRTKRMNPLKRISGRICIGI